MDWFAIQVLNLHFESELSLIDFGTNLKLKN